MDISCFQMGYEVNSPFPCIRSVSIVFGDDVSGEDMNSSRLSYTKDRELSISSADVSIDLMGSMIPGGQRTGKKNRSYLSDGRSTPDMFTPSSKLRRSTSKVNVPKHITLHRVGVVAIYTKSTMYFVFLFCDPCML